MGSRQAGIFVKHAVDRWEIPILLKAKFNSQHFVRPFVAAGVSLLHSSDSAIPPSANIVVGSGEVSSAIGPTFAAGASFGFHWVQPSIEFRYARWTGQPLPGSSLRSKQDEAQILAGLMFGVNGNRPDSTGVLEGAAVTRRVSLGIKGGLLLTDVLSTRLSATPTLSLFGTCVECGTSRTLPYVFGPALGVRILGDLSVTVEAFYSHADYDHTSTGLGGGFFVGEEKRAVDRWEAPLLLEYSVFKTHRLRSFVSGGASIQYDRDSTVQILRGFISRGIGLSPPQYSIDTSPGPQISSLVAGPTAGLGASFDAGHRVRSSIEVRYTYWADSAVVVRQPPPGPPPIPLFPVTIGSVHNQVQLLVGLMF